MKRVFVMPYLASLMAVTGVGAWRLAAGGHLSWLGPVLASAGFLLWLGAAVLLHRARTAEVSPTVLLLAGGGVALGVWGWTAGGDALPAALAGGAMLLHLLYFFWYSRFDRTPSQALEVGGELLSFELEDEHGNTVRSEDFVGAPAVLLFFRGNWCPLCMAQIREIAARYRELAARGATVALISPQAPGHTRKLAARFDVPFRFLVDVDLAAAKRLGIFHAGGTPLGMEALGYEADTVLPTVVVLDAEGRVLLADQTDNYRLRPEPEIFLAVLDGRRITPEPSPSARPVQATL